MKQGAIARFWVRAKFFCHAASLFLIGRNCHLVAKNTSFDSQGQQTCVNQRGIATLSKSANGADLRQIKSSDAKFVFE